MSNAQITIKRSSGEAGVYRSFKVTLDGKTIGKIADGETKSFKVTTGDHVLRMKIDWGGSNKVAFQIDANEAANFKCGSNVRGAKLFLWFIYATILSQKLIKLERID